MDVKIENKHGRCWVGIERDYAHIYNLYVHPEYRRQGRAKELIQLAIDRIKTYGYTDQIEIVAIPSEDCVNVDKLILFYERLGLKVYSYYG